MIVDYKDFIDFFVFCFFILVLVRIIKSMIGLQKYCLVNLTFFFRVGYISIRVHVKKTATGFLKVYFLLCRLFFLSDHNFVRNE